VKYIVGFFRFWYEFIVGDDWRIAIGVGVALGLSGLVAHSHLAAWWVLPLGALVILVASLLRATRRT